MEIIKPFGQLPELNRTEKLERYVPFIFMERVLSEDEVDTIKALWHEDNAQEGMVRKLGEVYVNYDTRKSKVTYVQPEEHGWIYDRLARVCIMANASMYKFDITGFQSKLQIANYSADDFFEWHLDIGDNTASIRKLSISLQLSGPEEYEGGELQFLNAGSFINSPKQKGSAVIFPSYLYHRVAPVTSGSRKSLVGWIAGPPYR